MRGFKRLLQTGAAVTAGLGLSVGAAVPANAEVEFTYGGYIRQYISMNLDDKPETRRDDQFTLQMLRTQVRLDVTATSGAFKVVARGRAVKEYMTEYQNWLKNPRELPAGYSGAYAHDGPAPSLLENYEGLFLRELYVDWDAVPNRLLLRLGKQQIAWGETDFFQANDLIHGFDYSWRSFLEAENEELRKPLILANAIVQVPELRGTFQGFIRPGLDRWQDIGTTYDLFGGRWANQPNKGQDFLGSLKYELDHPDGDKDDVTGGARWSGIAGDLSYSVMYLRTFNPDPVVSPARFLGNPKDDITPAGALGDLIYPVVDVVGGTASYYWPWLDTVLSTEVSYIWDKPYNFGRNEDISASGVPYSFFNLPSFGGVMKKDTLKFMLRGDYNLDLTKILYTQRPSFFSVQVFNTWIPDLKKSDGAVALVGYGGELRKFQSLVTAILNLNYMNDRINVGLAGGFDIASVEGFVTPSVEFVYGNNWRLKAEADIFFVNSSKAVGQVEDATQLLGYFNRNNQFLIRAQYQF